MTDHRPELAFVGFYWTLPVPRFDFTKLPETVEEAAAESRTIRYQRELVRHYAVERCGGRIIGEVPWMEERPDRGGHFAEAYLEKAYAICRVDGATLVYVNFGERYGWRKHMELRALLEDAPVECIALAPSPIEIDGEHFDPVSHFQDWRDRLADVRLAPHEKEDYATRILSIVAPYLPPERSIPDYAAAARFLDEQNARTTTGKPWSADSLRMFLKKYALPKSG
jgi:hypothetical protein